VSIHVFCHIEKTGGTSVIRWLRQSLGRRHCDLITFRNQRNLANSADIRIARMTHPHLASIAGHSIRPFVENLPHSSLTWSTLLREPFRRYVSDFRHFVRHMAFPPNFELWLEWGERANFQCQALGGEPSKDRAIDVILQRDIMVGRLDDLTAFQNSLAAVHGLQHAGTTLSRRVVNKAPADGFSEEEIFDIYGDAIVRANREDAALYEWARGRALEAPDTHSPPQPAADREMLNRLWRSAVYKPSVLQNPTRAHSLRSYGEARERSPAMWHQLICGAAEPSEDGC